MFRIFMFLALAVAVAAVGAFLAFGGTSGDPACGGEPTIAGADGITASHARFTASDRVCLQRYEWKSASAAPRGVVVVVHGLRDHGQRYAVLAERLAAAGFVVYAADLRGHGLSGGAPQLFRSISELVADADLTVGEAKKANPGLPVFLYGHSLGGLVVVTYARLHGERIQGAVLSGAALKLPPDVSAETQWVARRLGEILPSLPLQPVDDTVFVRTTSAKEVLANDPLVHHENLPALSAKAGLEGIVEIQSHLEDIVVPLLIMHGGADVTTNIEGSRELAARAKSTDKTLKVYDGVAHDLMHEPERDAIIGDVAGWLAAHAPPQ